MRTRDFVLALLAVVIAAVCVRLGIWQLHRLQQRRARNAITVARLAAPPVAARQLPRDTGGVHYRRAVVHGTYDYAHEIVLTSRTRNGSPGVNVVTPVRLSGSDTAVLVVRGWVYSPDGVHTDLTRWREGDSVDAVGYAEPFEVSRSGVARSPSDPVAYRWIDTSVARDAFPYPVLPLLIVLQNGAAGDTTHANAATGTTGATGEDHGTPPRLAPPTLDEGPHLSYAIQWFSFAIIAIVGTAFFLYHTRREERAPSRPVV